MEKPDTIETIIEELPILLVRQAYKKLKSGTLKIILHHSSLPYNPQ